MNTSAASAEMLISVIITNYNYGRYIGQAIQSALDLDWPAVEVIVVDDGSTDDSLAVIEQYRDKIFSIRQPNRGQVAASNAGFAKAKGEIVIFLDSDDTLERGLARELIAAWRPGLSKVQFQMRIIDGEGRPTGAVFPQFHAVPSALHIRTWVLASGTYPTPVGSGNAYARQALLTIFPLDGSDRATDSFCLAAAPFLGDVVTVAKPLVNYRVHGRNRGLTSAADAGRFGRDLRRAHWRFKYAQTVAVAAGQCLPDVAFHRGMEPLAYRLASLRMAPEAHPVPQDSLGAVVSAMFRAAFVPQGVSLRARSILMVWTVLVSILPKASANRLITWRFSPNDRPRIVGRVLRALQVARR